MISPKLTENPEALPLTLCGNTSEIMKKGSVSRPIVENTICSTIQMTGKGGTCENGSGNQPDAASSNIQTVMPPAEIIPAGFRPHFSNIVLIKKVVIMRATPTITAHNTGSIDTPALVAICTANTTTTTTPEHCWKAKKPIIKSRGLKTSGAFTACHNDSLCAVWRLCSDVLLIWLSSFSNSSQYEASANITQGWNASDNQLRNDSPFLFRPRKYFSERLAFSV